jgi:hypothetical protein
MVHAVPRPVMNIISTPGLDAENGFINTLDQDDIIDLRDKAIELYDKLTAAAAAAPLTPGPLFAPDTVQQYSRQLFPSKTGLADSDILCKHAILSLLARGNADLIMAFCARSIRTCKNAVGAGYIIGSFFNALDPDSIEYDIAIQVCLTDVLVDYIDIDYVDKQRTQLSKISTHFKHVMHGPPPTYANIGEFLRALATAVDAVTMLNILFDSTVGFIIAQLGESKSSLYHDKWSVNLICTFVDLDIALYGSGQGLLTMFLISVLRYASIGGRVPLACLELARSYLNLAGLIAYSKLGFKRAREQLLWEAQTDGVYFYDPSNLQMGIDLTGVTPEELIRRFTNGPGRDFKHELARVPPRRCDIQFQHFRDLFSTAPTLVNNTQVEAAVVFNMIECVENMIQCLHQKLVTAWRPEEPDWGRRASTFKTLFTESLDRLTSSSFSQRFDSQYEYTFCQKRIANFYNKVTTVLRNNRSSHDKIVALTGIVGNLVGYYQQLCNAAAQTVVRPTLDPTVQPPRPTTVALDPTRQQRADKRTGKLSRDAAELIRQLDEDSDYDEASAFETDAANSDNGLMVETDNDSDSDASTPKLMRDQRSLVPQNWVRPVVGVPPKGRSTSLAQVAAASDERDSKRHAPEGGGKKQTKNKRNKNKPKTKRRASNKKNKKAQQHAGRVSRHNKVFRRKTRKSK